MKPRVVRISDNIPEAVRVDRQTPYGNPFILKHDGNRDEVCDKFIEYAEQRLTLEPHWLKPLKDKILACHCVPRRCHAETLLRLANPHRCCICMELCDIYPDPPEWSYCPNHCPEHDYIYSKYEGWYCASCGQEPDPDWHFVDP